MCHLFKEVSSQWSSLFLICPQTFTEFSRRRIRFSFPVKRDPLYSALCLGLAGAIGKQIEKIGDYTVIHNGGLRHKRSLSSYWRKQWILLQSARRTTFQNCHESVVCFLSQLHKPQLFNPMPLSENLFIFSFFFF